MSKRSSSSKNSSSKQTKTVGQLQLERQERLQMFTFLPNDVLGIVSAFVCPPNCHVDSLLEHGAKLVALGHPLSAPVFSARSLQMLARRFAAHSADKMAVSFLIALRNNASLGEKQRLFRLLYHPLRRGEENIDARTLLKAALAPHLKQVELNRCDADHKTLCALLSGGAASAHTQPNAMVEALRLSMWDVASALLNEPYNVPPPDWFMFHTTHYTDTWLAPKALCRQLVSKAPTATLQRGTRYFATMTWTRLLRDVLTWREAGDINGDDLLSALEDVNYCTPEAFDNTLSTMLTHVIDTTTVKMRTTLLWKMILTNRNHAANMLLAHPYDVQLLCEQLSSNGKLDLAEPYLEKITDHNNVLNACRVSYHNFDSTMDIIERNPALRAGVGASHMLDRAVVSDALFSVSMYDRMHALGFSVKDTAKVLRITLECAQTDLARRIIATNDYTDEELNHVLMAILYHSNSYEGGDLTPLMETGRIDTHSLICAFTFKLCECHQIATWISRGIRGHYGPAAPFQYP